MTSFYDVQTWTKQDMTSSILKDLVTNYLKIAATVYETEIRVLNF